MGLAEGPAPILNVPCDSGTLDNHFSARLVLTYQQNGDGRRLVDRQRRLLDLALPP